MLHIILTVGIPASSKTTWAKAEIAKDPDNWVRINNDDIRAMTNGSVYSSGYEKLITETRNFLIREGLKRDRNIIIDNLNINRKHFVDTCAIAKSINKDITVREKAFYVDIEEAILRDSKREGKARVGEHIIRKWYKESGKELHKHYNPRVEIFTKRDVPLDRFVKPMEQDSSLPRCIVVDNDGTIANPINSEGKMRNPYDASTCHEDMPIAHTIEAINLYYKAGYKVLFVSGREDKDREPTERFYKTHLPEIEEYQLYMRPTGNNEKDVVIKERIFNEHIKDKYYVSAWFDDRLQIVQWLYGSGFPVFRVGDPCSTF